MTHIIMVLAFRHTCSSLLAFMHFDDSEERLLFMADNQLAQDENRPTELL